MAAAQSSGTPDIPELTQQLALAQGGDRLPYLIEIAKLRADDPAGMIDLVEEAISLLESFPSPPLEVEALLLRSWAFEARGDFGPATDDARRAEQLAQGLDRDELLADTHRRIARVEWRLANYGAAFREAEASRELLEPRGSSESLTLTLNLIGSIYQAQKDSDAALEHFLAALDMARARGDDKSAAIAQNNIAVIYWDLGQLEDAYETLLRVLRVQDRIGSKQAVAGTATNIALLLIELDRPAEALPFLERALHINVEIGDRLNESKALSNFGYVYEKTGELERALDYHRRALTIRQEIGDKVGIMRSGNALANTLLERGDAAAAVAALERPLALAVETGSRGIEAALLNSLSRALEAQGEFARALATYRKYHDVQGELADEHTRTRVTELQARYEAAERERDLESALDLAESRREWLQRSIVGSTILGACLILLGVLFALRLGVQRALAESELRYRALFDTSVVPTLLIDTETRRVIDLNQPARILCNAEPGGGDLNIEQVHPDWLRVALQQSLDASDNDPQLPDDCWVDRNGQLRYCEVRGSTVALNGHNCRLISVRDTTELRAQEEARLREDKMESLGVLAGGIAHDFNNALTGIVAHVDLARDCGPVERGRMLDMAEQSAMRASRLTSRLLAFARGGQPVRRVADIAHLLRETTELVGSGSHMRIQLDVAPDLWAADIDTSLVGQVFSNLIINAQQATSEGGRLLICASNFTGDPTSGNAGAATRFVRIAFEDNGPGIPKGIRDRVLDPYFTTKAAGSGLGLATAFAICSKHGGSLSFQTREGHGTTFLVLLPAASKPAPAPSPSPPEATPTAQGSILVLDDEPLLRDALRRILEKWGFRVETVADGQSAVRRYFEAKECGAPFDLLIMDLTIPGGMGGRQAIADIHALDPAARAIVVSGYSNDPTMANYREAGFLAALSKPFKRDELAQVLNEIMRSPEHGTKGQPDP